METQQIIVAADGTVSSLESKKGKGFDIRQLGGQADIVRSSVIEFIPELQMNVIFLLNAEPLMQKCNWLMTEVAFSKDANKHCLLVTGYAVRTANINHSGKWAPAGSVYAGAAVFADYEEAVAFEIKLIQALRERFGQGIV